MRDRLFHPLIAAALLCATVAAPAQTPEERIAWNQPAAPLRVAGNIYSVGTTGMAIYLIADPKGLILLDAGFEESAPIVVRNIRSLGFRVEDIKYLLNTHAHSDHAGGLSEIKRLSRAQMVASAGDRPELEAGKVSYRESVPFAPVKVDRVVGEGDEIRVGDTRMVAHMTPGHTRGCTSWTTRIVQDGRPLDVLFSCSITVAGQPLVGKLPYANVVEDYRATFAKLRAFHADIFLSNHGNVFDLDGKKARLAAGDADAFINPAELSAYVDAGEKAFDAELDRQRKAGGR